MNNDLKQTEKKLADAETVQAKTQAEFAKVTVELESLDTSTGDVDELVDRQMKLNAKRDILARRLALANAAVTEIKGDLLIVSSEDAARHLQEASKKLESAKEKAREELMKMVGGGLEPRQLQCVAAMVEICKTVMPLAERHEFLTCRARESAGCAANVIRQRSNAEGKERAAMQEKVFNGTI